MRNYYAIENKKGFNLVSDQSGTLFCPEGERENVIAYYENTYNLDWYYDDWDEREIKLSEGQAEPLKGFLDLDMALLIQEQAILDDAEQFEIKLICKEGLVYVESHWFLVLNDVLYYVLDSDFAEYGGIQYTLTKLTDAAAEPLLNIHLRG